MGEGIEEVLYRTIYPGIFARIKEMITKAIKKNEPRIDLIDVIVERSKKDVQVLNIRLMYKIKELSTVEICDFHLTP